ncbi:hypothetical protein V8E55_010296 [Tylopilus felleus]
MGVAGFGIETFFRDYVLLSRETFVMRLLVHPRSASPSVLCFHSVRTFCLIANQRSSHTSIPAVYAFVLHVLHIVYGHRLHGLDGKLAQLCLGLPHTAQSVSSEDTSNAEALALRNHQPFHTPIFSNSCVTLIAFPSCSVPSASIPSIIPRKRIVCSSSKQRYSSALLSGISVSNIFFNSEAVQLSPSDHCMTCQETLTREKQLVIDVLACLCLCRKLVREVLEHTVEIPWVVDPVLLTRLCKRDDFVPVHRSEKLVGFTNAFFVPVAWGGHGPSPGVRLHVGVLL